MLRGTSARGLNLAANRAGGGAVEVRHVHLGPEPAEQPRRRAADPRPGARDHGDLAVEAPIALLGRAHDALPTLRAFPSEGAGKQAA